MSHRGLGISAAAAVLQKPAPALLIRVGKAAKGRGQLVFITFMTGCTALLREITTVQAGGAMVSAVIASGLVACWRLEHARRSVESGPWAQAMTWDAHVRPYASPGPDVGAIAARMRQVEARVEVFAQTHGLRTISLSVGGVRLGSYADGDSVRFGRQAHLSLGHRWFTPSGTRHLPALVEHELEHVRRFDTLRDSLVHAAATAAAVISAATQPLPTAASIITALCAAMIARRWWSELACDMAAVRVCGRAAEQAWWHEYFEDLRAVPFPRRLWIAARSWQTHPPARVRLWWAGCVPVRRRRTGEVPIPETLPGE